MDERLGRLKGFAEEIGDRGVKHSARLLFCEFRKNCFYEISQLGLADDATVFLIDRIRFADNQPVAYERRCWPEDIGRLLMHEDLNTVALCNVLEKKCGIELKEATDTIRAVNATQREADLLGVAPGEALLERRRISHDVHNRPVEYARTRYRSDKYAYKVKLIR